MRTCAWRGNKYAMASRWQLEHVIEPLITEENSYEIENDRHCRNDYGGAIEKETLEYDEVYLITALV